MLTEDYILRMINQALAVFMTALKLKKSEKYKEALHSFDLAIESLLGLDARLVNQLEDSMLLDRLTFMGKLDIERFLVLADIFREQAEVYQMLGQLENGKFANNRSLRLYLEAGLVSQADPDIELVQKIEALRRTVTVADLSIETRLALHDYLDRLFSYNDDYLVSASLSRPDLQAAIASLENTDSP